MKYIIIILTLLCPSLSFADSLSSADKKLFKEHLPWGNPGNEIPHIRNAYVMSYDGFRRVPEWVAYHITADYLNTPKREGKYKRFRTDNDVPNPVLNSNYIGLKAKRGFARGHFAPYAILGGDRNGDGKYADDDDDDARTVYQGNYMSNIAPQHHNGFNGAGALWYKLERWTQKQAKTNDVWVFAGGIFGSGDFEKVGPEKDIGVPSMFYKIVAFGKPTSSDPKVLAFLFPHQRSRHGEIQDFLVSVDVIENLTGLDFFKDLNSRTEKTIEDLDTWEYWKSKSFQN